MRRSFDALALLESIGEPHQARSTPHLAQVPKGESTIVEAAARTETHSATVETDERQEDHIEPAGSEPLTALRLADSEAVVAPWTAAGHEAHAARCAPPIDTGQEYVAAAFLGERDERCCIELPGERGVKRDAPVVAELQGAVHLLGNDA